MMVILLDGQDCYHNNSALSSCLLVDWKAPESPWIQSHAGSLPLPSISIRQEPAAQMGLSTSDAL
jgi:hypothetical protein